MEGGVGIFGFADVDRFFGFFIFALKSEVFWFRCLAWSAGFLPEFSLWFSVFVKMMAVFRILPCQGSPSTPCSRTKIVIPRVHLHQKLYILPFLLEEWMTSLVCLAAVISGS